MASLGRNQSPVRRPIWLWYAAFFLGVVCHCLPPRLDVPNFAARCLHVHNDARDPSSERWNYGRECCPVILAKWRLARHLGIFYMPQIYDMGPTALFPRGRIVEHKICVLIFATNFVRNIPHSKNKWSRVNQNVPKYSCEVSVILVRFEKNFHFVTPHLNLWRWNFVFFLILAHPVYKMWKIQNQKCSIMK
jgi:hypothetical protein